MSSHFSPLLLLQALQLLLLLLLGSACCCCCWVLPPAAAVGFCLLLHLLGRGSLQTRLGSLETWGPRSKLTILHITNGWFLSPQLRGLLLALPQIKAANISAHT